MAACPIELIAESALSMATLVVAYRDTLTGQRHAWAESGSRLLCEVPSSACDIEVTFEDPIFGSRLVAVDRSKPDLPWLQDEDGDYHLEVFEYVSPPAAVRYWLSGSAVVGSYISRVEVEQRDEWGQAHVRDVLRAASETKQQRKPSLGGAASHALSEHGAAGPDAMVRAIGRGARGRWRSPPLQPIPSGNEAPGGASIWHRRSTSTPFSGEHSGTGSPSPAGPDFGGSTTSASSRGAGVPRRPSDFSEALRLGESLRHQGRSPDENTETPRELVRAFTHHFKDDESSARRQRQLEARERKFREVRNEGDAISSSCCQSFPWICSRSAASNRRSRVSQESDSSDSSGSSDTGGGSSSSSSDGTASGSGSSQRSPRKKVQLMRRNSIESTEGSSEDMMPATMSHDKGCTPATVERHVTDIRWGATFALACIILAYVAWVANKPCLGRRISWFRDYAGLPCNWADNGGKPLLFFCLTRNGKVDPYNPICIDECPNSRDTVHECPVYHTDGTRVLHNITDYPTEVLSFAIGHGHLCKPIYGSGVEWSTYTLDGDFWQVLLYCDLTMFRHWEKLVICLVVAILLSLVYVRLLKKHAGALVWGSIFVLVATMVVWATVSFFHRENFFSAILMLVIGCGIACAADSNRDLINKTTLCIELACKCVLDMPLLKFAPIAVSLLRLGVWVCGYKLTRNMLSCGWHVVGKGTVFRVLFYQKMGLFMIAFMVVWINLIISACWSFIIMYATAMWYFKGARKKGGAFGCSAVKVMLTNHMGSMCVGGLVVGLLMPLRFAVGFLTILSRGGRGCCCSCSDLVFFYEDTLEMFGKRAYADIAMNSADFFAAARWSSEVSRCQLDTVRAVHAACGIFQLLGVLVIFLLSRMLATMLLTESCSDEDACGTNLAGVFQPVHNLDLSNVIEVMGIVTALLAALVAYPFMNLFDTVSDAILYCATVEQMRMEEAAASRRASPANADFVDRMARQMGEGFAGLFGYVWETIELGCGGVRPGHPREDLALDIVDEEDDGERAPSPGNTRRSTCRIDVDSDSSSSAEGARPTRTEPSPSSQERVEMSRPVLSVPTPCHHRRSLAEGRH